MFVQGGVIAAVLIPVHILVKGILGSLGFVNVVDRHYDTWSSLLGNLVVKLYLLVLRRPGRPGGQEHARAAIFYGGAVLVTLITVWVLLITAPMSVG